MKYKKSLWAVLTTSITLISACTVFNPTYHDVEFIDDACIVAKDNREFKTCGDIEVHIDDTQVIIPKDFETDLGENARLLYNFISPDDARFLAPSVLLDYLYACQSYYGREEVDDIFYYALIKSDIKKRQAYWMYLSVRMFGKMHYHPKVSCVEIAMLD